VRGIARGDIIKAKVSENSEVQEGEFFEFESIVERGGHNTYRLLLRENHTTDLGLTKEELLGKGSLSRLKITISSLLMSRPQSTKRKLMIS